MQMNVMGLLFNSNMTLDAMLEFQKELNNPNSAV